MTIDYPYPVANLPLTLYGQDVRIATWTWRRRTAQRTNRDAVSRHELRRLPAGVDYFGTFNCGPERIDVSWQYLKPGPLGSPKPGM
jgi:hypothetical protein